MDKRAQAAMEFLMTYGWAILAAIIAVGVLAYIGLTDPFQWFGGIPATVAPPFSVKTSSVTTTYVNLEMMHTNPGSVNITSIQITNCGSNSTVSDTMRSPNTFVLYTIVCSPALTSGDVLSGNIIVNYTLSGSINPQWKAGTITQKVL